jgi:CRISPR-associated endonuclease Csn1
MSTILGLDIGTNSIGWCLTEKDNSIKDIGVRIFPVGVKEDDYNKSGSEISKNATRRQARGIRRLYDRYKQRRKQLKKILNHLNIHPNTDEIILAKELYSLRKSALDEKVELNQLGRIFLLLNQRRGFKSSKKDNKSSETAKERSEMKIKMNELSKKIDEGGFRTIGEYFYSLFQSENIINWHNDDEPIERIRTRFVYRKLYEIEFDAIWNKQKRYYPEILTDSNYDKIKYNCIFYQRPLKSQKHLVSKCRFEKTKRVAPKSCFEFQEFRIWQTLSNIRITDNTRFRDFLTLDEKNIIASELQKSKELTQAKLKKLIGLSSRAQLNELPEKIKGNTTVAKLCEALGENYFMSLTKEQQYKLWHTVYFANDEEWLYEYAISKLNLSEDQAERYVEIDLEPEYCNISAKAIERILAHLKLNHDYTNACAAVGYHHSFDEETDSKDRVLEDKIVRTKDDDLRNPLVQQAVSEMTRLVNAIIKEHGKPERIRVEFARSLKKPKDVREKMKRKIDEKEKRRSEYVEFLKSNANRTGLTRIGKVDILKFELWLEMEFNEHELKKINKNTDIEEFRKFAKNIKANDKEKYALYLECGRICPYTGEVINLTDLFSSEVEVEHIIPYSKCMDDSFGNKTLTKRWFNSAKGNQTPFDYFSGKPNQWKEFKERIQSFPDSKQEKFIMETVPEGFLNSQLNNTAYIAKEARKKLKTICKDVRITNGQATSLLRRFWGLNDILNVTGENEKSRHDHRHHAIDALVIAYTTENYIKKLSNESQFDFTGRMILKDVKFPYQNFKLEAVEKLSKVLVSYRNKKRLITVKKNKYIHSKKKVQTQKTIAVRGALHEESFYGSIINPHTREQNYVIRKPISSLSTLKQIEKIVDPAIKQIILTHVNNNGGEKKIKQSLDPQNNPVFIYSKDGKKKIQIKNIRVIDNAESMIQLRPKENPNLFVSSGNNYCIAIYENEETGKRDFETVSFFEATQRALNKTKIINTTKGDKQLLMTLSQKDLVIIYEKHKDEINWDNQRDLFNRLYKVVKFSGNQVNFALHNYSKVNTDKPKEYPKGVVLLKTTGTLKAIKVRITITGKIIRV